MKNSKGKGLLWGALAAFVVGFFLMVDATAIGFFLWIAALLMLIIGLLEISKGRGFGSAKRVLKKMTDETEKQRIMAALENGSAKEYREVNTIITDREVIFGGREGGVIPTSDIVNAYYTNIHNNVYDYGYKWIKVITKDSKVYYGAWSMRRNNAEYDTVLERLRGIAQSNRAEGGIE